MTESDRRALARLVGGDLSPRASTDDLQSLLLQVSLALLMIFMIACFLFKEQSEREKDEAVMAVNRQKLELALDKVAEDHRIRYGLNALMTQGVDGSRAFEPDGFVRDGHLDLSPAARAAFSRGSSAAYGDYAASSNLVTRWEDEILASAELTPEDLTDEDRLWLGDELPRVVEEMRRDVRGVQRSLAARVQRALVSDAALFDGVTDPGALAETLKEKSLSRVAEEIGAEVLP